MLTIVSTTNERNHEMTSKTRMETTTCSRCGGSGRYSYNMRDGDRCYGCSGKGVNYTKRANVALNMFRELRQQPLDLFNVGDLVRTRVNGVERTVQLAEGIHESGVSTYGKNSDGSINYDEKIVHMGVTFSYGKPENRQRYGYSWNPDSTPTLGAVVSDELHAHAVNLLVEYQTLLTQQGTVRKDSVNRANEVRTEIAEIFSNANNRVSKPVKL